MQGNSEPLSTQDKDNNLSSINLLRQVEKKLYAIPIAFVMLRIWGTVQFFISIGVFNVHKISYSGCLPKWLFTVYYAFAIIQVSKAIVSIVYIIIILFMILIVSW